MNQPMGSSIVLAAALAAVAVQGSQASSPAPLKATGPWNVDYAENMCLLQRAFGSSGDQVTLGFKPGILSDQMRLVIVRNGREKNVVRGEAQISFDGGEPAKAKFAEGFIETKGVRATLIDLEEQDLGPLPRARLMRVQADKLDLIFALTTVPTAMKALEACEKDLLVTWGMKPEDVAAMDSMAQHPRGIVSLFSTDDYPGSAIRNHEQGTAGVRFWIGADGRASDCQVVEPSGSETLDKQTCMIIEKRSRYRPARDKNGEIIRSIGFQRIRWELPGY